jgi:hypothetical protein
MTEQSRKMKRENIISGLQYFYERLEDKTHGATGYGLEEETRDEMQMELEKIFMQLRNCFNDVLNNK